MESDNQTANDTLQLEKILGIVKLVQGLQENNKKEEEKNAQQQEAVIVQDEKHSGFDEEFQFPALRAIKAAIPYLDYKYQRNLGLMVKFIEMDRLLHRYSTLSIEGQGQRKENKKDMLMAIKPELDLRHQKVLDIFLKIIEIKELAEGLENG